MNLKLNIYDKEGKKVVRVAEAEYRELLTGVIIDIFDIFKIEDEVPSMLEMSLKIATAYNQITKILHRQFPDVTKEEWRCTNVKELAKLMLDIVGYTFDITKIIPIEKK